MPSTQAAIKLETRKTGKRIQRLCRLGLILLCLAVFGAIGALFFSVNLLSVQDPQIPADAIVILGGEKLYRTPRGLELYQQQAAPWILVTGRGDCEDMRSALLGKGVPTDAVQMECEARTTRENAKRSVPILREFGAKRVIIVTSWFHSRRALRCFEHYAPEIQFISLPTRDDLPKGHWPDGRERTWVLYEYVKLAGYWVCYGISPF